MAEHGHQSNTAIATLLQNDVVCGLVLVQLSHRDVGRLRQCCRAFRDHVNHVVESIFVSETHAESLVASGLLHRLPCLRGVTVQGGSTPSPAALDSEGFYRPSLVTLLEALKSLPVRSLTLKSTSDHPVVMTALAICMTGLTSLTWENPKFEQLHLEALGTMTQLRNLELLDVRLAPEPDPWCDSPTLDALLMAAAMPRLTSLHLRADSDPAAVWGGSAERVQPLPLPATPFPALASLRLDVTNMAARDAPQLQQAMLHMSALTALSLLFSGRSSRCLQVVPRLKALKYLSLHHCGDERASDFNDNFLQQLSSSLAQLETLDISVRRHCASDAGFALASAGFQHLRSITFLQSNANRDDEGVGADAPVVTAASALALATHVSSLKHVEFGGGAISQPDLVQGAQRLQDQRQGSGLSCLPAFTGKERPSHALGGGMPGTCCGTLRTISRGGGAG